MNIKKERLLKSFCGFIASPDYKKVNKSEKFGQIAWNIFRLWSLAIVFVFIASFLTTFLLGKLQEGTVDNYVVDFFLTKESIFSFLWP